MCILEQYAVVWTYFGLLIQFSVDAHLGYFRFWALLNKVVMTLHKAFLDIYIYFLSLSLGMEMLSHRIGVDFKIPKKLSNHLPK